MAGPFRQLVGDLHYPHTVEDVATGLERFRHLWRRACSPRRTCQSEENARHISEFGLTSPESRSRCATSESVQGEFIEEALKCLTLAYVAFLTLSVYWILSKLTPVSAAVPQPDVIQRLQHPRDIGGA